MYCPHCLFEPGIAKSKADGFTHEHAVGDVGVTGAEGTGEFYTHLEVAHLIGGLGLRHGPLQVQPLQGPCDQ